MQTPPAPHTYGPPARQDVLPIIGVNLVLILLAAALIWLWQRGDGSWLGVLGGIPLGVMLAVAWSLRDGLLQGEPRRALAQRIARGCLLAGLALAAALWLAGPGPGATGLVVAGIMLAAWLSFVVVSTASVNREVTGEIVTVGTAARGRALVVYHSAHGGLMRALQGALADGLQADGWQVDLSPANRRSPIDLTGYQLLVLGSPCYNRGIARPIRSYLDRLGELHSLPVVLVVTGFNATDGAMADLQGRVESAHGTILDQLELWTARPNRAREGTTESAEIMRRTGARLARTLPAAAA